jgi:membrane protein required for colicin V production
LLEEPPMITLLDIFLLAVMLISGLLAMVRGFMREVLSIASWAAAALVTFYFSPQLLPVAKSYITNDWVALGATLAGLFLGTLIVVSVLTIRISDMVLDSRIGALDRTLGFLFGLARGLLIVVVAYLFFDWLVPTKQQPLWVQNAKSRVVLDSTRDWLRGLLPENLDTYISKALKKGPKGGGGDEETPESTPDRRSDAGATGQDAGYSNDQRANLRQLIGRTR